MLLTGGEKRLRERGPWNHCSFSLPPSYSPLPPEEAHSGGMGLKWRKLRFANFSTVPDILIWVLIDILTDRLTPGPQAIWKWTARPSPIFLLDPLSHLLVAQCLHATLCSAPFTQNLQTKAFCQLGLKQTIIVWRVQAATQNPDYWKHIINMQMWKILYRRANTF